MGSAQVLDLFLLVFVSVLREGIETVIFLNTARLAGNVDVLAGALAGICLAVAVGFVVFSFSRRLSLKTFFSVSSVFLVLFAAGLFAGSIGEFQEAGVLPSLSEHVWDLDSLFTLSGPLAFLNEEGFVGGLAKDLFGYTASPSLEQVLGYCVFLAAIFCLARTLYSKPC